MRWTMRARIRPADRSSGARQLFFDERFESGERLIPLCGDAVEVIAECMDRLGVELEEGVTAGAERAHDASALEDAQVLGDGLASETGTMS